MAELLNAAAAINEMLPKVGNEMIYEQVAKHSVLLDSGRLKKRNVRGQRPVVNLSSGGSTSTKIIKDGDALTFSSHSKATQEIDSVIFSDGIDMGYEAVAQTTSAKQAVNQLVENLKSTAMTLADMLDTGCINDQVATVNGTALISATSFNINEFAGLDPETKYDQFDSGDNLIQTIEVTKIDYSAGIGGGPFTVTCVALTAAITGTGNYLKYSGADVSDLNKDMVSFEKCARNEAMYGLAAGGVYGWRGLLDNTSGALTRARLTNLENGRKKLSKKLLDYSVTDSINEERYVRLDDGNRHIVPGGSLDSRGYANVKFKGADVLVDENARGSWSLIGKECTELAEFRAFEITGKGSLKSGGPMDIMDYWAGTAHKFLIPVSGVYQQRVMCRQGIAFMTAITD